MDFGVCGWMDTVNGFNLPFVLSREVGFFVPKLAWMLIFDVFLFCSILHVPFQSNGYLENVGGYYISLIGTPHPPNDPPLT